MFLALEPEAQATPQPTKASVTEAPLRLVLDTCGQDVILRRRWRPSSPVALKSVAIGDKRQTSRPQQVSRMTEFSKNILPVTAVKPLASAMGI